MAEKYKISNLAKDIEKKAKDIVEFLKSKGKEGKTSSSVLENNEINIVLEHFVSGSTVDDINKYLYENAEK
ncbi:MAG: translation initiation factor IF-2 N-terminal domain-containing protein, partial [Clostridia bacterium]|nr:translation initiation factor IF-2 N-terminal domain-containing protein [Clostridia bacterium]